MGVTKMNALKITALIMIIGGVLGLAYGGFSYTKDTQQVKLGPIEMSVKEKERVNVPVWAGAGLVILGNGLLIIENKKS